MNSGNSGVVMRMAWLGAGVVCVAVGLVAAWLAGGIDTQTGKQAALIACTVVILGVFTFEFFVLLLGVVRGPAGARRDEVKVLVPGALVIDADMSRDFRAWIQKHRLAEAQDVRVSRFGVALSADSWGLAIWAGAGLTPFRVAAIPWGDVERLRPSDPADFIGADTTRTAVRVQFTEDRGELRIPLIAVTPSSMPSGDYADGVAAVDALDRIRSA